MEDRKNIDKKDKIDTKDLFASDEDFYKELDDVSKIISNISQYKNHVMDSADNLYDALNLDTEISKRIERLYIYAHLNNDFDLSDARGNDFTGKVIKLANDYESLSSYLVPELLKSDYSLVSKYIKNNKKLLDYDISLKNVFRLKDHVLNESEELIISKLSDAYRVPEEASSKLLDADLKFADILDEDNKKVKLTTSNYAKYIESNNRQVRKNAFETFYKGYESVINTTASLLSSEVRNNNNMANIRKYNSAMESSLVSNDVDPSVYETLLKSIDSHINIIHKEWKIRKDIMQLNDLHIYDTYVSLVPQNNASYTFEEAKKLVLSALKVMGNDYEKKLEEAFSNNWIDVYPTENKRSGGYCTCAYLAHPYVFLNFDNRYDEVSTVAHELGHAMHYYYAQSNNQYQNYNYSIFVAEVASQVNELLLSYYMLDKSSKKEEKLFILDELIKRFKASVVRQTMFSEFERDIHEYDQKGNILTKEVLNDLYYKLNQKYYGNEVIIDDEIKYEWSRIPHFYYNFYVYQYATGYISALKIAKDIYNKKDGALDNYLKFLRLGNTMDPVASLGVAGVDLTSQYIFDEAFKEFDETMDKFVTIYNEGSEK